MKNPNQIRLLLCYPLHHIPSSPRSTPPLSLFFPPGSFRGLAPPSTDPLTVQHPNIIFSPELGLMFRHLSPFIFHPPPPPNQTPAKTQFVLPPPTWSGASLPHPSTSPCQPPSTFSSPSSACSLAPEYNHQTFHVPFSCRSSNAVISESLVLVIGNVE